MPSFLAEHQRASQLEDALVYLGQLRAVGQLTGAVSPGQVYVTLGRLERTGLVVSVPGAGDGQEGLIEVAWPRPQRRGVPAPVLGLVAVAPATVVVAAALAASTSHVTAGRPLSERSRPPRGDRSLRLRPFPVRPTSTSLGTAVRRQSMSSTRSQLGPRKGW